jgi:hypothetical protein
MKMDKVCLREKDVSFTKSCEQKLQRQILIHYDLRKQTKRKLKH